MRPYHPADPKNGKEYMSQTTSNIEEAVAEQQPLYPLPVR
jgi:hypothetical protein